MRMEPRSSIEQVTDSAALIAAEVTGLLGRAMDATRREDPPAGERRDRLNALIDLVLLGGHLLADSGGAVVEAAVDRITDEGDEQVLRASVGQGGRLQRVIEIQNIGRSEGDAVFQATELIGPDETARISAPSVESGRVEALGKANVKMTVDVGDALPGVYAGVLRVYNSDAWLPIEITVKRVVRVTPSEREEAVRELTDRVKSMLAGPFADICRAKAMGEENVDAMLASVLKPDGRCFRSMLCAAACQAMGGKPEDALDAMVGIELVHTAMLIRDDIEDGATERRGGEALHVELGVPKALAIADLLLALGTESMAKAAERFPGVGPQLMAAFVNMLGRTAEGQAREVLLRKENPFDLGIEQVVRIMHEKTAWYTALAPIQIGALIGAEAATDPRHLLSWSDLISYGTHLGLAFQLTDDLKNLDESDGKNASGSDIAERKPTLILELLRQKLSKDDQEALNNRIEAVALSRERNEQAPTDADAVIQEVVALVDQHNIRSEIAALVIRWCRQAQADLALAFDEALGEGGPAGGSEGRQWRFADFLGLLPQYLEDAVAVWNAEDDGGARP